jgi:mono/diheme cytochrome c family protein
MTSSTPSGVCARRVAALVFVLAAMASVRAWSQGERARQAARPGSRVAVQRHDDLQPAQLPPLPYGMTIQTIAQGDSVYHGKGNCSACHGSEGEGLPAAGDAITVGLNWAQYDWTSIDSLIDRGIPQVLTRSPIGMPARGGKSNLTDDEVARVAAYVWTISQTRGEPWPGGHESHANLTIAGADKGTATRLLAKTRPPVERKPPR